MAGFPCTLDVPKKQMADKVMEDQQQSDVKKTAATRKRLKLLVRTVIIIILVLIPISIQASNGKTEMPVVIIRVDDIQDFAFREAQLFLIGESIINEVPLSMAVIAGMFGQDNDIVTSVKQAVSQGTEVTVHGWEHEDFTRLSLEEQSAILSISRSRIKDVLGYDANVFVPPLFTYNEDTFMAMQDEDYYLISAFIDVQSPGLIGNVMSIPATVELSDFSEGTWKMKSPDATLLEISKSVRQYGYAAIVTHPQEFISEGKLNPVSVESFRSLLRVLKENYSLKTLKELGETRSPELNGLFIKG